MNVLYIIFGFISSTAVWLSEAQISQLSNSPYGGGTYIDNFWAAKRPKRITTTPRPRRSRIRQHVVNPQRFGFFAHTTNPLGERRWSSRPVTQRSTVSRPSDFRRDAGQGQPFAVSKAEEIMYQTKTIAPTTLAYGTLLQGVNARNMKRVTALYSLDHHRQASQRHVMSSVEQGRHSSRTRFKVLADGSIVDYGISSSERNSVAPITREVRLRPTTTVSPRYPALTNRTSEGSVGPSVFPVQPTTTTTFTQLATSHRTNNNAVYTDKLKPARVWLTPTGLTGIAVRLSDLRHKTSVPPRQLLGPLDDGVRKPGSIVDDQTWQFERSADARTKPFTRTRTRSMTTTTTTTKAPTTTTTTTTVAPTTTTQKPKRSIWNGPAAVNITYGEDNHVCPPSRARWQDYTVYLETKPRLCMIQITWNARYKREPRYHNSWWGVDVEWVYKTVYDPEVKFVDLHGWQ